MTERRYESEDVVPVDRPESRLTRLFDAPRRLVFDAWIDLDVPNTSQYPDGPTNTTPEVVHTRKTVATTEREATR